MNANHFIKKLKGLKRKDHYEYENCNYSCPKHEDYCGPDLVCNCGVDEANQKIDELLEQFITWHEEGRID